MTQRSTYNCILTSEKRESVAAYTAKRLNDTTKIKNCVISTLFEKKLHKCEVEGNQLKIYKNQILTSYKYIEQCPLYAYDRGRPFTCRVQKSLYCDRISIFHFCVRNMKIV